MNRIINRLGILCLLMLHSVLAYSQGIAINNDGSNANSSAMLDVKSTNSGMLIPRMTQAERNGISSPASSLLIYQTDNTPGFYYYDGGSWVRISVGTDSFDDADADPSNEFQNLSISGHDITLSDGGGTVTVPDANTTYSAGNQLSLSGTTFNVQEGSGSGLDADLLDGHQWSEITGLNGWTDDGTVVRLTTSSDDVGIGTSSPQAQLHITENLQIGTDGMAANHVLSSWTENGYETNFFFRETPTHGMGIRYNATDNKLYFDRYADQATPTPLFALQRDAAIAEISGTLDMHSNQIHNLDCDGGSTDAASCGWVNANDDNTTYSAGNQLSLSGTTFNVSEGSGSGLDADLLDGQHWSDIQAWVNANDDSGTDNQTLTEVLSEGNTNGGTDIIMSSGSSLENQESDKNITLLDDNPTWHGNSYGGITQFYGDGSLNKSKLEAGGLYLERDIEVTGRYYDSNASAGSSGDVLTSTGSGTEWTTEPENSKWALSANMSYSEDDLWGHGGSGTGTLSGDDVTTNVTMPFSITIEGTSYNTVGISSNGFIEFGGTSSSDLSNECLPTNDHSSPFLAAYWDDLETEGSDIRYGYVGTAPNRVYIIDYTAQTWSGDNNVRFQIQIHESSALINVKYRHDMDPESNGQSATIGFQGAGGSSAKSYSITCNGKVLDDNRDDSEGWSISPIR